jgi:hypothetical protein
LSLSNNGTSSDLFHRLCDGKGPYIVLIEANYNIFGYYMPTSFEKVNASEALEDSYIFSITNKSNIYLFIHC